ncbi:MAG: hypothetical protein ACNA8P_12515 [Phycisphaerales bacterium]
MRIALTSAAVLAIAGAASAAPFSVSGLVDFGGPGNDGAALTVGGGIVAFVPGVNEYLGPGNTGAAIAPDSDNPSSPMFTPGTPGFSSSGFEGGYFMDAPVMSGIAPDGRDGVFLMALYGDFNSVNITDVNVEITDANGTQNLNFTDFGPGGSASGYELVIFSDNRVVGEALIWIVIPTPASASLIGLAGLAAMRRRR